MVLLFVFIHTCKINYLLLNCMMGAHLEHQFDKECIGIQWFVYQDISIHMYTENCTQPILNTDAVSTIQNRLPDPILNTALPLISLCHMERHIIIQCTFIKPCQTFYAFKKNSKLLCKI